MFNPFPTTFMSSTGSYHASAVYSADYFDGAYQAAPTVPDSSIISGSVWVNVDTMVDDFGSSQETNFMACGNDIPLFNFGVGQLHRGGIYLLGETDDYNNYQDWESPVDTLLASTWYNILFNQDFQNNTVLVYVGDTAITMSPGASSPLGVGFNMKWSENTGGQAGWMVPRPSGPSPNKGVSAADYWWTTSHLIDWSVQANRRKFHNALGKPVSMGANGSTPFGYIPEYFLSGNATGFLTNRGSAGSFTLLGTLTNASTSPSD